MNGFEIIQTQHKGRAMFATNAFKPGDIILEEHPFVSSQFSWNAAYKYRACEYCMTPLETTAENVQRLTGINNFTLPYAQCCETIGKLTKHTVCPNCSIEYCSENCRLEAMQRYHTVLCLREKHKDPTHPINKLIDAWKNIHYPPETTTITFIIKLIGMYLQSSNKDEYMAFMNEFQSKIYNEELAITHKILGANFEPQLNTLYTLYCQAFQYPELELFLTPESFRTFFVIMGTNGQGIGSSAFASWVKNVEQLELTTLEKEAINNTIDEIYEKLEEVTGHQFLNNEGSALYSLQSKINHSCLPNAESTFPLSNHKITIRAIENIEPGEEICISYLDECFLNRSRHSRQKELRENYLFVCRCCKCELQINDPDITSDEDDDADDEPLDFNDDDENIEE